MLVLILAIVVGELAELDRLVGALGGLEGGSLEAVGDFLRPFHPETHLADSFVHTFHSRTARIWGKGGEMIRTVVGENFEDRVKTLEPLLFRLKEKVVVIIGPEAEVERVSNVANTATPASGKGKKNRVKNTKGAHDASRRTEKKTGTRTTYQWPNTTMFRWLDNLIAEFWPQEVMPDGHQTMARKADFENGNKDQQLAKQRAIGKRGGLQRTKLVDNDHMFQTDLLWKTVVKRKETLYNETGVTIVDSQVGDPFTVTSTAVDGGGQSERTKESQLSGEQDGEMQDDEQVPEMESDDQGPEMESDDQGPEMESDDQGPEMESDDQGQEMESDDQGQEMESDDQVQEMSRGEEDLAPLPTPVSLATGGSRIRKPSIVSLATGGSRIRKPSIVSLATGGSQIRKPITRAAGGSLIRKPITRAAGGSQIRKPITRAAGGSQIRKPSSPDMGPIMDRLERELLVKRPQHDESDPPPGNERGVEGKATLYKRGKGLRRPEREAEKKRSRTDKEKNKKGVQKKRKTQGRK
ncbi:hypothetical protein BSKO_02765 [Bryopsis sp. KO-2023]|nr:hypothetical protein BSKO_02765 [Bryopsis sp. KO-2023]